MGMLENWVKLELQELVSTFVLLVIIGGAFVVSNPVATALTGSPDIQSAATLYLNRSISDMSSYALALTHANFLISRASGFSYSASFGGFFIVPFWSGAPRAGLSPLNIAISNAIDSLSNAILVQVAQKTFLVFFIQTVPTMIFPLGIILRLIPPTRRTGSTIIAISIGMFMIYPFALTMSGEIYKIMASGLKQPGSYVNPFGIEDIGRVWGTQLLCSESIQLYTILGEEGWILILCAWMLSNPFTAPAYPVCRTIVTIIYQLSIPVFQIAFTPWLVSYVKELDVGKTYDSLYNIALPGVVERIVLSLVLTLFTAIITISLTRSVAVALGGESQFYGLSKII
ncbi:hypothetical protein FJZ26_00955 [Candidatus Parvarchaeota archaeon]|nr:hypothetical protein [Candidatus Parvarchaeota archaeon]